MELGKVAILLPMLTIAGCSFFHPTVDLTNEEIFEQYSREVKNIVGFNIVGTVKSHECKFIKYEAPESRLNPIFGCKVVLQLTDSSEDIVDEAIFTRSGATNSNFKSYLVQSKFLSIAQDKVFEKRFREKQVNS